MGWVRTRFGFLPFRVRPPKRPVQYRCRSEFLLQKIPAGNGIFRRPRLQLPARIPNYIYNVRGSTMSILTNKSYSEGSGRSVRASVILTFISICAISWIVQQTLGLSHLLTLKVTLFFSFGAALIVLLTGKYLPSRPFGLANRVTLFRSAMTTLLLALIGEESNEGVAWFAVIMALLVLVLDGIDGWLARSRDEVSQFGARFDMETDALFVFCVSALVWQFGKAGPWIVVAGMMRYLFVASGYVWPWMGRPLPASLRRKVAFVLQTFLLMVCLTPILSSPLSDVVAFVGLVVLTGSFAIDVAWLAGRTESPSLSKSAIPTD